MSATGNNKAGHDVNGLGAYDTPVPLLVAMYRKALDLGILTRNTPIIEPHVGSGNVLRALLQEGHRGYIEILDIDPLAPGLDLGRELAASGAKVLVDKAAPDAEARSWATELARAEKIPDNRLPLVVDGFLIRRPLLSGAGAAVFGNPPYCVVPGEEVCPKCSGSGIVQARGKKGGGRPEATTAPEGGSKICPTCKPKDKPPEGFHGTGTGKIQPAPIPVAELHVHRALQVADTVIYVLRGPFREGQERYRSLYSLGKLAEVWTSPRRASFAWGATDSTETAVFTWKKDRSFDPVEGPVYTGRWLEW